MAAGMSPREFHLAIRIYRDLVTSSDVQQRLAEGEEPGELHQELARQAVLSARVFWAEAKRQVHAACDDLFARPTPAPRRAGRHPVRRRQRDECRS